MCGCLGRWRVLIVAAVLAGFVGSVCRADEPRSAPVGRPFPRIRNGEPSFDFPAVGAMQAGDTFCTATLIGCETVLTAAHCVCPEGADTAAACRLAGIAPAEKVGFFFQHAGFVIGVRSVTIHPQYEKAESGDLAIIKLNDPLTGIAPQEIDTVRQPAAATAATIVGFGRTGEAATIPPGVGIKRIGSVVTSRCERDVVPADTFVCQDASGSDSTICMGDSGGPLLVDFGDGPVVAAVASGVHGLGGLTCTPPFVSYYSDVFRYRRFITDESAGDLGEQQCGDLPPVGSPNVLVHSARGELDSGAPEFRQAFDVPPGTTLLRVTMNGVLATDLGRNNFDLYVKPASPPSTSDYQCADTRSSAFGACEIAAPVAGTWHVLARQVAGSGELQITTTLFGGSAEATATPSPTPTRTRAPTQGPVDDCVGDCDGSRTITVDELVRGVAIILGERPLADCTALDPDLHGVVGITNLLSAVNGALRGCAQATGALR